MKLKSENFVQLVTTHKTKFLSLDPSLGDQKWFTKVKIAARSTGIGRAVYESVKGKLIKLFDDCESITMTPPSLTVASAAVIPFSDW